MEDKENRAVFSLMGTQDPGERTIRSVYKVKKADNTNTYDRVHFETDSKMVCDATEANVANMVARRSSDGSIAFQNVVANGSLNAYKATTLHETLEVKGNSNLIGTLTVGGNGSIGGTLLSKGNFTTNGTATIDKTLLVKGTATLNSTLSVVGNVTTNGTYSLPNCTIQKNGSSIQFGATGTGINDFYFNKPLRFDSNSPVSTNLNADRVDNCHVSDSTTTTTNLWTASKIDATKTDKTTRVNAGSGLTGGGALSGNVTITHGAAGTPVKTLGAARGSYMMVRSVGIDTFGHVSTVTTEDMSNVFATYDDLVEGLANGNETVSGQFLKHSITDANGNVVGAARNNVNNVNMKNYSIDYNTSKSCIEFTFV